MSAAAVVFDFDGVIVDSEMAIFEVATTMLGSMGHRVGIEQWARLVGLGEEDSWAALCDVLGCELDRAEYESAFAAHDPAWRASIPLMPGVTTLLDGLHRAGVPCAVASSSSAAWIHGHLDRLGLSGQFDVVASADRVGGRVKPAPDLYLLACNELGVTPAVTVALEDSAIGVAAAISAGLSVVAVPNAITRLTDLSAAHTSVASLEDLTVETLHGLARRVRP